MNTSRSRDLAPNERALLSYLLQASFPGAQELAAQVEGTKVVGGLPTLLDLAAPRTAPIAALADGPIPVRAYVEAQGGQVEGELLVWVKDGYLSGLEFAWYTDEAPSEMPSPDRVRIEH
jgi:hypothetical protein